MAYTYTQTQTHRDRYRKRKTETERDTHRHRYRHTYARVVVGSSDDDIHVEGLGKLGERRRQVLPGCGGNV